MVESGGESWRLVRNDYEWWRRWGTMESGEQVNSEEKLKGEMHKEKQT